VIRSVRRALRLAVVPLLLAVPAFAAPDPFSEGVRPTSALTPQQELESFRLPPGFKIQLVASEPDINKPINIAIDAKGRLWVTSTIEYPWPVKDPNVKPRDSVKVLEIDPATGRATKVTTFADGLNIPAGVYPYKNGCIAWSIPNIWHLQDTDGDGVADRRDVLYGPFDVTRDTHGMNNSFTRGYDGFLYATHGFNNRSRITAADGSKLEMDSGNVYRMTLDGRHVDHITHGPVNPFGLMFDSAGNLFVADCHTKPIQAVLRGAWYEHFGRPHDGIGFYPKIMGHLHGSTAIGGVVVIAADRRPREFRGNLLCGNPMTSRVDRDSVTWTGSTPTLHEAPDFVATSDPWFRPVAFAFAPDGSIYVADFYNRIIGHYEVPLTHPGRDRTSGRIWRIVPPLSPSANQALPDLSTAIVEQLIQVLAHPNITARMLATDQLVDRIGPDAASFCRGLLTRGTPTQKVHALWALFRLNAAQPQEIATAAKDGNRLVRAHALRVLSELPQLTSDQRQILLHALKDDDALVRRNAAETLGLHPSGEDLRPLLELFAATDKADTHLAYVIRIALRRHLEAPGLLAGLNLAEMSDTDRATVNGVLPAVHTPEAARFIVQQLQAGKLPGNATNDLLKHAARYGDAPGAKAAIEFARADLPESARLDALRMIQSGMQERGVGLPESARAWAAEVVVAALRKSGKSAQTVQTAADLARTLSLKECAAPLATIVNDAKADAKVRLAAVQTILALDRSKITDIAHLVATPTEPATLREAAAKALSEVNTDEARQALLMPIREAPQAVAAKLAAALASRPEGATTLMEAFERNTILPRLLLEPTVKDKLAAAKVKDLDARIAKLTANLAPASAQLDALIAKRRKAYNGAKADAEKGQLVFQKNCAVCHQISGQGALVGPQLDGASSKGLDRLLEDVIDPNRNVDPLFRYTNVTLKDGDTISGLIRSQTDATLTLVDVTGNAQAIDKKQIESLDTGKLSLMPAGLGELLSADDFNNLFAFLLTRTGQKQP
jgi:putative heme-binding domain-containing protein